MRDGRAQDLSSNLEDYLEVIAHLEAESRVARSRDIAQRLGVTKASVTAALRALSERGLVNYQPYSHITLTAQGQALAQAVIRRHEIITRFFHDILGMERQAAEANACRVEHAVDEEVMRRLAGLLETLATCPRCGAGEADGCHQCLGSSPNSPANPLGKP